MVGIIISISTTLRVKHGLVAHTSPEDTELARVVDTRTPPPPQTIVITVTAAVAVDITRTDRIRAEGRDQRRRDIALDRRCALGRLRRATGGITTVDR